MKVSIITATYNSEKFINSCLESVKDQNYNKIEHVIIDGKSTDRTLDIIESTQNKVSRVYSEDDTGIYDALNKGVKKSNGEIIGILHADDIYFSDQILTKVVQVFNETNSEAVYGDLLYVGNQNVKKVIRHWRGGKFDKKKFLKGWMPPHPTFFVKRKIFEKYGLYRTDFRISADYELMLRFLYKNSVKVSYLPEILVKMRMGGLSNRNWKSRYVTLKEDYCAWKVNDLSFPFYIPILKRLSKIGQYFIK